VVDITPDGFELVELAPGVTFDDVEQQTGAPIKPGMEKSG
jgi:3-oxoacid CoA-transferase subunit B